MLVVHEYSWGCHVLSSFPGIQYTLENERIMNSLDLLVLIFFILAILKEGWVADLKLSVLLFVGRNKSIGN